MGSLVLFNGSFEAVFDFFLGEVIAFDQSGELLFWKKIVDTEMRKRFCTSEFANGFFFPFGEDTFGLFCIECRCHISNL